MGLQLNPSVIQPVANHYIAYAILAPSKLLTLPESTHTPIQVSNIFEFQNINSVFHIFLLFCSSEFYCFSIENHLPKCIQEAKGLHTTQSLRIFQNEINILLKMQPITQQGIFVINMKRTAQSTLH
jgi:hypothetical protein